MEKKGEGGLRGLEYDIPGLPLANHRHFQSAMLLLNREGIDDFFGELGVLYGRRNLVS